MQWWFSFQQYCLPFPLHVLYIWFFQKMEKHEQQNCILEIQKSAINLWKSAARTEGSPIWAVKYIKNQRYFFENSSCSSMTADKQIRRNSYVGKCTWKQPLTAKLTVRLNWQEISNVTCLYWHFSHHINWHINVLQTVFAPPLLLRRRNWFWVLSSRSRLVWNVHSNARL